MKYYIKNASWLIGREDAVRRLSEIVYMAFNREVA